MFKFIEDFDFSSYTLIVPCVSVGNVGQLAADLVISSLKMHKVAIVNDPAVIPVIGGDPFNDNSKSLMMSCELYANASSKLAVLQFRAPLVKKYTKQFLSNLVQFAKKYSTQKIVILTSSFASERHSISSVPFRYLSNKYIEKDQDKFKELEWVPHNTEPNINKIHGGGFANQLFDRSTEMELPCIVLFKYCSEGDNIPDAIEILSYLNNWIKFFNPTDAQQKLEYPQSWKLLYGSPPPKDIY